TVSDMPSSAMEPLGAMKCFKLCGARIFKRCDPPSGVMLSKTARPSTWPETRCPPSSSPILSEGSRLIFVPTCHVSRLVFERLSAETSTVKFFPSFSTTVKQQPEQQMDAPMENSVMSHGVEMIKRLSPLVSSTRVISPIALIMPVNMCFLLKGKYSYLLKHS